MINIHIDHIGAQLHDCILSCFKRFHIPRDERVPPARPAAMHNSQARCVKGVDHVVVGRIRTFYDVFGSLPVKMVAS